MPQEVTDAEEWIPYWGDPQFLLYWGSFPIEEDTWNFKINWWHHAVIGAISLIGGPFKITGLSFKTLYLAIKGASKKFIAKQISKTFLKEIDDEAIEVAFRAAALKINDASKRAFVDQAGESVLHLSGVVKQIGGELSDTQITLVQKSLSHLSKKEMRQLFASSGKEMSRGYAVKLAVKDSIIENLKTKLKKLSFKKGISEAKQAALILGGTVGTYELALNALASSTMRKYDSIGNAVALLSPGIKKEDKNIFKLPKEMETVPVMLEWVPKGNTELKHFHLVSPCYLNEFTVEKKYMRCQDFSTDSIDHNTTCKTSEDPFDKTPITCGTKIDKSEISKSISNNFMELVEKLLKINDKKIFEFGDNWEISKIYLPWTFSNDGISAKYHLSDFYFKTVGALYFNGYSNEKIEQYASTPTKDFIIGEDFDEMWKKSDEYNEKYIAKMNSADELFLDVVGDKHDSIIRGGKESTVVIYLADSDDVVIDIYDHEKCSIEKEVISIIKDNDDYQKIPYKCEDIVGNKIQSGPSMGAGNLNIDVRDYTKKSNIEGLIKTEITTKIMNLPNYLDIVILKVKPDHDITLDDIGGDICDRGDVDGFCVRKLSDNVPFEVVCGYGDVLGWFGAGLLPGLNAIARAKSVESGVIKETCKLKSQVPDFMEDDLITFDRYITLDEDRKKVMDIYYTDLSFKPVDDVTVTFGEGDEDITFLSGNKNMLRDYVTWDSLAVSKETGDEFSFLLSGIGENGEYSHVSMKNCGQESVIVKFPDGIKNAKMDVDSNYCARDANWAVKAWNTKILGLFSAKQAVQAAVVVASIFITKGTSIPIILAANVIVFTAPGIVEDVDVSWPG